MLARTVEVAAFSRRYSPVGAAMERNRLRLFEAVQAFLDEEAVRQSLDKLLSLIGPACYLVKER